MIPYKLDLSIVCALAVIVGLVFRPNPESSARNPSPQVSTAVQSTPPPLFFPLPADPAAGQKFLFSGNNPHARGSRIVDRSGNYNINSIKVAVPYALGKVEYLSGSDPRATEYLNRVHAEQANRGFDSGPVLVDGAGFPQPAAMVNLGPRSVKFKFLPSW